MPACQSTYVSYNYKPVWWVLVLMTIDIYRWPNIILQPSSIRRDIIDNNTTTSGASYPAETTRIKKFSNRLSRLFLLLPIPLVYILNQRDKIHSAHDDGLLICHAMPKRILTVYWFQIIFLYKRSISSITFLTSMIKALVRLQQTYTYHPIAFK